MKFFLLEKYDTYHVLNSQFIGSLEVIQRLRIENHKEGRPLNHGLPFTSEEIKELIKFSKKKPDMMEYFNYFQRNFESIFNSLEKNNLPIPELPEGYIEALKEDDIDISDYQQRDLYRFFKWDLHYPVDSLEELNEIHEQCLKKRSLNVLKNNKKDNSNLDVISDTNEHIKINKLLDIKKYLESQNSFDVIAIQCGFYYNLYNEHAKKYNALWGHQTYYQGENLLSGFPASSINLQINRLEKEGLTYAFVTQHKYENDSIIRVVDKTSCNAMDGISFKKSITYKKNNTANNKPSESEIIFLNAILNNADPFTGEVLSDDSIWKHPKIISDIKKYLDKHSS